MKLMRLLFCRLFWKCSSFSSSIMADKFMAASLKNEHENYRENFDVCSTTKTKFLVSKFAFHRCHLTGKPSSLLNILQLVIEFLSLSACQKHFFFTKTKEIYTIDDFQNNIHAKHPLNGSSQISNFKFCTQNYGKRSNERIFFEAQSNSQTLASSSKNLNRFLDRAVYKNRHCTSPEMLQKQTYKKTFQTESERNIQKKVEHSKTDVKEVFFFDLSFCLSECAVWKIWDS